MRIKIWGPATWNLLHTICEKIYEDKFDNTKYDLYKLIALICVSVPCPICRDHAINYLKTNKIENCTTKQSLKLYVYNLHNQASINAKNTQFDLDILNKYTNFSFVEIFNTYITIYNANKTDDLQYSFRRRINLKEIKQLLVKNTTNFNQ